MAAGRRAPVLVQLEPGGAAAQLLPQRLVRHRVALAEQRDVDRPVVERLAASGPGTTRPASTVVAFVPSAGPVPPPMIVVMPGAERLVDDLRADEVDVAVDGAGGEDRPLPARISVDGPITSAGSTPSIVSGLPALPMPTMRPSRTPTSALTTPQWSRMTAPVITRSGVPSARVAVDWPIDSRITLPPPNTASSPPTQRSSVDLDQQVGVGEADAVAGGRPVQRARSGRGRSASRRLASSGPATSPRRPATTRPPAERHQRRPSRSMPGSKRTDVPAGTSRRQPAGRGAVERQRRVGLGEVVVRADLDRPVAGVHRPSASTAAARR